MRVLLTGCAAFIGMHCALRLLERGDEVLGADNLSPYYSVALWRERLRRLEPRRGFRFEQADRADAYSHLHALPASGQRYFTVYGPWGWPDISPVLFASAIMKGGPIQVFNRGDIKRDFTYNDDAVEATLRVLKRALGRQAPKEMMAMLPGDLPATYADTRALQEVAGLAPSMPLLAEGLARFAEWFKGCGRL
jgi:nucleoside-diphosphate-sugar epimerase